MPIVWIGLSALSGLITGWVWEKEEEKPIVTDAKTGLEIGWFDKLLMVGAGIGAYYIYKRFK